MILYKIGSKHAREINFGIIIKSHIHAYTPHKKKEVKWEKQY